MRWLRWCWFFLSSRGGGVTPRSRTLAWILFGTLQGRRLFECIIRRGEPPRYYITPLQGVGDSYTNQFIWERYRGTLFVGGHAIILHTYRVWAIHTQVNLYKKSIGDFVRRGEPHAIILHPYRVWAIHTQINIYKKISEYIVRRGVSPTLFYITHLQGMSDSYTNQFIWEVYRGTSFVGVSPTLLFYTLQGVGDSYTSQFIQEDYRGTSFVGGHAIILHPYRVWAIHTQVNLYKKIIGGLRS